MLEVISSVASTDRKCDDRRTDLPGSFCANVKYTSSPVTHFCTAVRINKNNKSYNKRPSHHKKPKHARLIAQFRSIQSVFTFKICKQHTGCLSYAERAADRLAEARMINHKLELGCQPMIDGQPAHQHAPVHLVKDELVRARHVGSNT